MRILIVENEPMIAMLLTDSLESAGHDVVGPASTFAEALAMCEEARPDLAPLDIHLRDGGSGVEVARARRAGPALGHPGDLHRWVGGRRAGAKDIALGCIREPHRYETVLRGVEAARAVMGGRQPGAVPAGLELFSPGA